MLTRLRWAFVSLLQFGLVVTLVAMLWRNPLVLFLVLLVFASAMLRRHDLRDFLFFVVPAVMGYMGEVVATTAGAWQYANVPAGRVPAWVAVAWGCGALALRRFIDELSGVYGTPVEKRDEGALDSRSARQPPLNASGSFQM
jgi:hypothetical protein